jgi:hypothetical protein
MSRGVVFLVRSKGRASDWGAQRSDAGIQDFNLLRLDRSVEQPLETWLLSFNFYESLELNGLKPSIKFPVPLGSVSNGTYLSHQHGLSA